MGPRFWLVFERNPAMNFGLTHKWAWDPSKNVDYSLEFEIRRTTEPVGLIRTRGQS